MRRIWKTLVGVLAAVAMLLTGLAGASTAFAADETTKYTITINESTEGYSFEAYQVFSGDLYEKDGKKVLSNIVWGSGVNGNDLLTALQQDKTLGSDFTGVSTAAGVAEKLGSYTDNSDKAQAFASIAAKHLKTDEKKSSMWNAEGGNYTISNLEAGYYLVKNADTSGVPSGGAATEYVLRVVGNVTVTPKSDVPTVEKKVQDINDSTDTQPGEWQDSADHDVNDVVPFKLTGTLPDNYDAYKSYKYAFHDTLSKGLTFNADSLKVYAVNGDVKTELKKVEVSTDKTGYTVATGDAADTEGAYAGGHTLDIAFADLKQAVDMTGSKAPITKDTKIVVEYTATLNDQSIIGSKGNPNKVYLEFSNNPNEGGEGDTGHTPEDQVIVFTYELDVTKTDDEGNPLEGAKFTLYKKTSGYAEDDGAGTGWKQIGNETEAVCTGTGESKKCVAPFQRVDDGDYKLVETTVPDGYNKAADVEFTITATHTDENKDGIDELTGLKIKIGDETEDGVLATGVVSATVENKSGSELPETGGMGTTILYVVGAAVVVFAGLGLAVTLRRRQSRR